MDSPPLQPPYEGNMEALNEDLYLLLRSSDLDINYEVFCTLMDLLRRGVTAEALYFVLTQTVPHSGLYQKMRKIVGKKAENHQTTATKVIRERQRSAGDPTDDRSSNGRNQRITEYI